MSTNEYSIRLAPLDVSTMVDPAGAHDSVTSAQDAIVHVGDASHADASSDEHGVTAHHDDARDDGTHDDEGDADASTTVIEAVADTPTDTPADTHPDTTDAV